jgi:hypothetical protein
VRRPAIVVGDISLNGLVFEWITEALEQRGELFGRKQLSRVTQQSKNERAEEQRPAVDPHLLWLVLNYSAMG